MIQLAEPFKTPYDFRFAVFGIPVRVQALFWLTAAILGYNFADSFAKAAGTKTIDPSTVFLVIVANFLAILVHELGHSFMMRRFGIESHIVLYWFGGLAIHGGERDDSPWGSQQWRPEREREVTSGQRILISFAGPLAGFGLAALVVLLVVLSGGRFWFVADFPLFFRFRLSSPPDAANQHLYSLTHVMLWINIFWGLINLLPVFPLDGGQIAREIFVQKNPWQGAKLAMTVSLWTAVGVALFGLFVMQDMFVGLLFASLAATSYQALQQINSTRDRW